MGEKNAPQGMGTARTPLPTHPARDSRGELSSPTLPGLGLTPGGYDPRPPCRGIGVDTVEDPLTHCCVFPSRPQLGWRWEQ